MPDRPCPIIHLPGGKHVNFLSGFPNTHRAAPKVFCHRRDVTRKQLALLGMHEGAMKGLLDFDAWAEWIRSLDAAWLFLLILAFVIAVVGFWSRSLRPDKRRESGEH